MSIFYVGDKVPRRNEKAGKLDSILTSPYVIVETDPSEPNVVIKRTRNKRIRVYVNRLKDVNLRINSIRQIQETHT